LAAGGGSEVIDWNSAYYDWDKAGKLVRTRGVWLEVSLYHRMLFYFYLSMPLKSFYCHSSSDPDCEVADDSFTGDKLFEINLFGQGVLIHTEKFGVWKDCPPAETMVRVLHTPWFCVRLRYHSLPRMLELIRQ
jgi:hypothetical protein